MNPGGRPRARRHLFVFSVILAATLFVSCASAPQPGMLQQPGQWNGAPLVMTRFGAVQGTADADDTFVWKAVPYARPPVGDLRWRAPQDPVPWTGVRSQPAFNAGCTQFSALFGSITGSEDCLYLNVWRPQGPDTALPVYVWIHGGGNSIGSATMVPDYYGNRLASRSRMVFVSFNYRLGPFGWFTHPALRDGASAEDASGNYGTLDIIQALRWIQQNIEAFGGDPGNVTVTGESAGAFNVLSLLISPPAAGLFQRAMSQSGAARTRGLDEGDAKAREVLAKLLVADRALPEVRTAEEAAAKIDAMSLEQIRAYLRSRSDRQLMRAYGSGGMGMIDNPAIFRDGAVISASGFNALTTANKVPLIVGSNREELKLFLMFSGTIPWQSELYQAAAKYGSDRWKASGVDEVARRLSSRPDQPPVYAYQFAWGAPDQEGKSPLPGNWGRRLGAFHSLEIPFFLGTDTLEGVLQMLLFTRQNEAGRKALSGAMMDYAAQFARTGNPNRSGSGLPLWTPWVNDPGADKCIVFDVRGDAPDISMSSMELTDEGVLAALKAALPQPLASQTLQYLSNSRMPSGVR